MRFFHQQSTTITMAFTFRVVSTLSVPSIPSKPRYPKNSDKPERLDDSIPPWKNINDKEYGDYCICARADMFDGTGKKACTIKGYDTTMEIVKFIDNACETNARHRNMTCGRTSVVVLPTLQKDFVCEGVYFEVEEGFKSVFK
jgi:hypothetical protein